MPPRWWWIHWFFCFFVSAPVAYAALGMAVSANHISHNPIDHHKVTFLLPYRTLSRHLIAPLQTRHRTENRLRHLFPVHLSVIAGCIHPWYPHSIPLHHPSSTAELSPLASGCVITLVGRLPGSYSRLMIAIAAEVRLSLLMVWE